MGGQKLQDTERTNEVGYGWMNLGSLLLGLTACTSSAPADTETPAAASDAETTASETTEETEEAAEPEAAESEEDPEKTDR